MQNIKSDTKRLVKDIIGKFSRKIPTPYPVLGGEGELLRGRCALITGGGSGIGFAIAEEFVKNGASVIIVGRDENRLKQAIKKVEKIRENDEQKVYEFRLDIADTKNLDDLLSEIIEFIGELKIDILVNNAGVGTTENFGGATTKEFERVLSTNVEGTYFVSQFIYNYMKKNGIHGNNLNVLSSSARRPATSVYALSKWALAGLTLGMAKMCLKDGIVVNGVAPGRTATSMLTSDPEKDISESQAPIGRYIMPEEIANIATLLVSDLGRCIVGDTVYVSGGSAVTTFDDLEY